MELAMPAPLAPGWDGRLRSGKVAHAVERQRPGALVAHADRACRAARMQQIVVRDSSGDRR